MQFAQLYNQDEFNKLVEAEFVRVKYKMSSRSFNNTQTQNSTSNSSSTTQTMFSAYLPPIRNPNPLPSVSGIHQLNTGSISENSVNWRLLSDAVKNAQNPSPGTSQTGFYPNNFGYSSPPPQPEQNLGPVSNSIYSASLIFKHNLFYVKNWKYKLLKDCSKWK